jgi:beta-lactamase class A
MTLLRGLLRFLALLVLAHATATAAEVTRLLDDAADPGLQQRLENLVADQGLTAAAERGDLELALVLLGDTAEPRLAMINGHKMVYAASLPKIAILLGAAVALEDGRLVMDEALHRDLNDMIRNSCNECATRVLDRVGRQALLDILESPGLRFYDRHKGGGLWVGKDYGPGGAYRRDPLTGLSHAATAFQAARFYYRLHAGTLVSPRQSEMMLETLARPGLKHKFVKGLAGYEGLEIFRKSGTWKNFHSDSALVRFDGHAYIMVALADDPEGEAWLQRLAAALHDLAVAEHRTFRD